MSEFFVRKVQTERGPALYPCHDPDEDYLKTLPRSQPLRVKVSKVRNYEFHKKFFALLNYAFEMWEPEPGENQPAWAKHITPEKNFDRFRKDIIILAGFREVSYRVNGDVRVEAKSISFANMSEDEFGELYEAAFKVILQHVLKNYDDNELRMVMNELEAFG